MTSPPPPPSSPLSCGVDNPARAETTHDAPTTCDSDDDDKDNHHHHHSDPDNDDGASALAASADIVAPQSMPPCLSSPSHPFDEILDCDNHHGNGDSEQSSDVPHFPYAEGHAQTFAHLPRMHSLLPHSLHTSWLRREHPRGSEEEDVCTTRLGQDDAVMTGTMSQSRSPTHDDTCDTSPIAAARCDEPTDCVTEVSAMDSLCVRRPCAAHNDEDEGEDEDAHEPAMHRHLGGTPLLSRSYLQRTRRLNARRFSMVQNINSAKHSSSCSSASSSPAARSLLSCGGRSTTGRRSSSSSSRCGHRQRRRRRPVESGECACGPLGCSPHIPSSPARWIDLPGVMEMVAPYCDVRTLVTLMCVADAALTARVRSDAVWRDVLTTQMRLAALLQHAAVRRDFFAYFVHRVMTTRALDGVYRFQLPSLAEERQQRAAAAGGGLLTFDDVDSGEALGGGARGCRGGGGGSGEMERISAQGGAGLEEEGGLAAGMFEYAALHLSAGGFGHCLHRVGRAQLILHYTNGVTEVMHGCCRYSLIHRRFVLCCSVFGHEARGPMFFVDVLPPPTTTPTPTPRLTTPEMAHAPTLFSASSSTLSLPSPHRSQPDRYADPHALQDVRDRCDNDDDDDDDDDNARKGDVGCVKEAATRRMMGEENDAVAAAAEWRSEEGADGAMDLALVLTPYARSLTPNSGSQITARHILTVHRVHENGL